MLRTHLSFVMVFHADQQRAIRPAIGEAAADTAVATESPASANIDKASNENTPLS